MHRKYGYNKDFNDSGMQFERLVTSEEPLESKADCHRAMRQSADGSHINYLQTMKIGQFTALVDAEIDAIEEDGSLVEIKSRNPKYFETKLMFQMMSSGSR